MFGSRFVLIIFQTDVASNNILGNCLQIYTEKLYQKVILNVKLQNLTQICLDFKVKIQFLCKKVQF